MQLTIRGPSGNDQADFYNNMISITSINLSRFADVGKIGLWSWLGYDTYNPSDLKANFADRLLSQCMLHST